MFLSMIFSAPPHKTHEKETAVSPKIRIFAQDKTHLTKNKG